MFKFINKRLFIFFTHINDNCIIIINQIIKFNLHQFQMHYLFVMNKANHNPFSKMLLYLLELKLCASSFN